MSNFKVTFKALKVVYSCQTEQQLHNAYRYVELAFAQPGVDSHDKSEIMHALILKRYSIPGWSS